MKKSANAKSTSAAPKTAQPKRRSYKFPSLRQPTWQSPIIEYFDLRHRSIGTKLKKRRKLSGRVRLEYKLLAMLAFFSISIGLWENFRQLWLQQNGFVATDISNITSLGMLFSVLAIILVGKLVKMERLQRFMALVLLVRTFNQVILYFLNNSGLNIWINGAFALDIVTGSLIITSVYPMLTTIMKSNNAYSRRKLVEYLFRDIGLLIGGILIGQQLGAWLVTYDSCLMISAVFSLIAGLIMWTFTPTVTEKTAADRFSAVKFVLGSKIHRNYMIYVFLCAAAYNTAIGLRMLMLTDYFNLSASMATNFLLIVGLGSDFLGILALRHFTPKNDYTTMLIKFGIRLIFFALAFFSGNFFLCFIALAWVLLSSTAYENITDGYYINSVDNRHQLKYNTLKYVVNFTGDAVGVFLAGQMFALGPAYVMGLSGLITVFALGFSFYLVKLRTSARKRLR